MQKPSYSVPSTLLLGVVLASHQVPAIPPCALTDDLGRAGSVQASIRQRFWDDDRHLYRDTANDKLPADMWTSGIALSALNGAVQYDPRHYTPVLLSEIRSLDRYWDGDAPLPGYEPAPTPGSRHDKYYDDNAWVAIALAEAARLTGDPAMLNRARATVRFVLSGEDEHLGGGIWWQEGHKGGSKNTCANAPAAVACLAIAEHLPAADAAPYRAAARRIVDWTRAHLQNTDGLFADRIDVATGRVNHGELTYNIALMIRAQLMLAEQTGSAADRAEAEREAVAADRFVDRHTNGYRDAVKWSHLLVEADLAVARATTNPALAVHLRERARAAVNVDYAAWTAQPSDALIDVASLSRELWLLAEDSEHQATATTGRAVRDAR